MPIPVDVIVPHFRGKDKFLKCLETLFRTDYPDFRVIVVDNGSEDGSVSLVKSAFPGMEILRLDTNLGFAGGCNAGVKFSERELVALLNDDTEVEPEWLSRLVEAMVEDENIAVTQPKLLSIYDRKSFDYAGAMGGLLDIFGYPFCYGRLFETSEADAGQYDWVQEIFWAAGSACLFRRNLYLEAGGLDERFFAHQEEIDLCWRFHLMGYRVIAVPQSRVYHYAGATLPPQNFRKKYLNHRNSIMMLIKNYRGTTLLWALPCRIILELASAVLAVKQRDYRRVLAVFGGGLWNLWKLPALRKERKKVKALRKLTDKEIFPKLYQGTVALKYYLGRRRTWGELMKNSTKIYTTHAPLTLENKQ
jgi:GT2 family glycosyltransferase